MKQRLTLSQVKKLISNASTKGRSSVRTVVKKVRSRPRTKIVTKTNGFLVGGIGLVALIVGIFVPRETMQGLPLIGGLFGKKETEEVG